MILTESEIIILAGAIAIFVELTLITYYVEKIFTFLATD
jgi:hypothetical protein